MFIKYTSIFILFAGLIVLLAGCEPDPYPKPEDGKFSYLSSEEERGDGLPYWPRLTSKQIEKKGHKEDPRLIRNFEEDKAYQAEKKKDMEAIVKEGISLEELLNYGLKHSNTMIDVMADFEIAKRTYLWSRYKFVPKPKIIAGVTTDADVTKYYQKLDTAITETFKYGTELSLGFTTTGNQYYRTDDDHTYETVAGITLTQPLLRGRYNLNYYDDWKKYRTAMRNLVNVRESFILDLINKFYDMKRLQDSLKIAQDSLERNKSLLEKYEERLKMGKVAEADVESIRIQHQRARNQVLNLQDSIVERRRDFNYFVGLPKKLEIDLVMPELKYAPMTLKPEEIYSDALKLRVDYLNAKDKLADINDERRKTKNDLLPQLNVFFGYNYRSSESDFGNAITRLGKPDWEFGFTFEYDFDRKPLRISLNEISERFRRAKRDFLNMHETLMEEIDDFVREEQRLNREIAVSERDLSLKKRELERDLDLFEKGKISNDEVVRKENEYNNARDSHSGLLIKYEVMKYRQLKIRGILGR